MDNRNYWTSLAVGAVLGVIGAVIYFAFSAALAGLTMIFLMSAVMFVWAMYDLHFTPRYRDHAENSSVGDDRPSE